MHMPAVNVLRFRTWFFGSMLHAWTSTQEKRVKGKTNLASIYDPKEPRTAKIRHNDTDVLRKLWIIQKERIFNLESELVPNIRILKAG